MRRISIVIFSLVLSTLALLGNVQGLMLCAEPGTNHAIFAVLGDRAGEESVCANELGEACDRSAEHACKRCVDVELRGIGLALHRSNETVEAKGLTAAAGEVPPSVEWRSPSAVLQNCAAARAPPALPEALIVAETTVLLL